jgi:aspartate/methionine/tyrosine aminotransferase
MVHVQDPIIPIVGRLIAETPGTISLGQGLVSWGPPQEALDTLAGFSRDPERHRYGAVEGEPDLLQAIDLKLRTENGLPGAPDSSVFVTAGGNMAFFNAILATCDTDDEVVLQTPYYFNHEMAVAMSGARAVCVPTDRHFHLDPDRIGTAITSRTRAVVTISPNNPTGAVYPEETLRAVNAMCARRGVFHIHDEVYEYFTYNGHRHFSPGSIPGAAPHTISLFSLSKAYGFASWRVGYMVAPAALADAIRKIQDTNLICAPIVSQLAAAAAMRVGRAYCARRLPRLDQVRRAVQRLLGQNPDLFSLEPLEGAFYGIVRVQSPLTPLALVERLVREHRVAAIPGTTFGLEGCALRVSYGALEPDTVNEGVRRLAQGLRQILTD